MKIPRKLSDIKVKNYLEYQKFLNSLTDEQKNDEQLLLKNTICIFYGIDDQVFNQIPFNTLLDMYKIIENIFMMDKPLVPIFKLGDKKYGINPNFDDMTFGELVDCDTDDIIKQIAILYRPIKKKLFRKYTIEKYKADISHYELLKEELTLDVYYGFISFFLNIQSAFINYTHQSLMEMGLDGEKKQSLEKYMDGFLGYMNYVMEISPVRTLSLKNE